jgi:hypothetical protein
MVTVSQNLLGRTLPATDAMNRLDSSASQAAFTPRWLTTLIALGAFGTLAGCATALAPTAGPAAANTAAAPATAAKPPTVAPAATPGAAPGAAGAAPAPATPPSAATPPRAPGSPAPFAEVTRQAKSSAGFLTVWTQDAKTWLEIPAALLDKPFFLGASISSGLGERFFLPGLMPPERVVMFKRVGDNVQLIAVSLHARTTPGTPLARAIAESYSDSLLAAAPLAAAPHPERKSLLVDAQALLGGDLFGVSTQVEAAFRLPYALDRANSRIETARTSDKATTLNFKHHFGVPKLPAPPVMVPGAPPPNPAAMPNPPSTVPDARSFFLGIALTLAPLPATPMTPRLADQRVGFFTDGFRDLSNDTGGDRRTHYITRWRLEKKDPAAPVSDPKEPIRAVMDRNIPPKWRDAVRAGIVEWNKAFERAGFSNAIVVEQQADDAEWSSTEGTRMLAVRWFAMEGPGATAVGPSQTDARTGEILRGAAIIPENWVRLFRTRAADAPTRVPTAQLSSLFSRRSNGMVHEHADGTVCDNAHSAMEQAQFGFALLVERGTIAPDGPEANKYIADALKDVVMHEVGHAIGLRHNFRASTGVTQAQLRDARFVAERGVSNSVMDYNALNIALGSEGPSAHHMTTLGMYDYWAIEYGYREFAPGQEKAGLAAIATRQASEPGLAYGTDEDLVTNNDPLINQRDLGDNPMAFAQRQMKLSRELWELTQARKLAADDDMTVYRRNLERGLAGFSSVAPMLAKYVGGTYTSRALAGAQQALVQPVPVAQQRQALDILVNEVFSSRSFKFDPAFLSRLGIDQFDRWASNRPPQGPDFSLVGAVLDLQRGVLDNLMSDGKAVRMADNETKVADAKELLSYAELQDRLSAAVWQELKAGPKDRNIDSLRRNLQREHVKRLVAGLVRPTPSAATDLRAVHRQVALALEADLKRALAAGGWTSIAKAHLADSQAALAEALKAPLVKQGA